MTEQDKNSLKVGILFSAIFFLILIFLLRVTFISIYKPDHFISRVISHTDLALRGKIITKDNYIVAENKKIY
jgi:cell division protein FtsI/penicillin-binding protein 2